MRIGAELEMPVLLNGYNLNDNYELAAEYRQNVNNRLHGGKLVTEFWKFILELNSPVWALHKGVWGEVYAYLGESRMILEEEGRRLGLSPLWAGYLPFRNVDFARFRTPDERYDDILGRPGHAEVLKDFTTASLQAHYEVADADLRVETNTRMLAHQPLLKALAANSYSPFSRNLVERSFRWQGMPNTGVPEVACRTMADFETLLEAEKAKGMVKDATTFWWATRPHNKWGTIEGRVMCAQPSLERTVQLIAFHSALAEMELANVGKALPNLAEVRRNYYAAARDGVVATVSYNGSLLSMDELFSLTLENVQPFADNLGCADLVEGLTSVFAEGTPAEHVRAVWEKANFDHAKAWPAMVGALREMAGYPQALAA